MIKDTKTDIKVIFSYDQMPRHAAVPGARQSEIQKEVDGLYRILSQLEKIDIEFRNLVKNNYDRKNEVIKTLSKSELWHNSIKSLKENAKCRFTIQK